MFNIKINNSVYEVLNPELVLLQQCELYSLYIPRFCYHDRLSIAGNCRMCLVELEASIKPVIACSTSILPNMSIFTNSKTVKKIRENVLEFLLINHPLDCPICDQGGECDLQDQSMVFGSDRGRFVEVKRSVEDKNFGPFIKTIMTRCIHCTRCIRFFDEIAGTPLLGTLGRGRDTEIGTYTQIDLINELSGNVIDLCPVGALTSKPYAFTSRPWELTSFESIDIFDSLCSNIRIDIKGNTIMRILPKLNEHINEEWITDKVRFSYDGLRKERLTFPLVKVIKRDNILFTYNSWEVVYSKIKHLFMGSTNGNIHVYGGELIDLYSLYLFKYWLDTCNLFINFHCDTFNLSNHLSSFISRSGITNYSKFDSILFYNINLKEEISVLNTRIRKFKWKLKDNFNVYYVGIHTSFNYKIKHLGLSYSTMLNIIKGKHFICNNYINSTLCLFQRNLGINIYTGITSYVPYSEINTVSTTTDIIHYNYLGFKNVTDCKNVNDLFIYYLFNYYKPLVYAENVLNYIIYQGHHGGWNTINANIILPILSYTETRGFYMNLEGCVQLSEQAIYGPGVSKSSSDIFINLIDKPFLLSFLNNVYFKNVFNCIVPVDHLLNVVKLFNLFSVKQGYVNKMNLFYRNKFNTNIISTNSLNYSGLLFSNIRKKSMYSSFGNLI
jgi:NADH dehydrogenase (ubiquinone) Fe-S protein 1